MAKLTAYRSHAVAKFIKIVQYKEFQGVPAVRETHYALRSDWNLLEKRAHRLGFGARYAGTWKKFEKVKMTGGLRTVMETKNLNILRGYFAVRGYKEVL